MAGFVYWPRDSEVTYHGGQTVMLCWMATPRSLEEQVEAVDVAPIVCFEAFAFFRV